MLISSTCQRMPHAPLRERKLLRLAVACANVCGGCIAIAHQDTVVQPYQSDPELDPDREAPEEIKTQRLQQDVYEWLVCLKMLLSLFVCVGTVTTM